MSEFDVMAGITDPYFCDPDICERAQDLIESGAPEEDIISGCEDARRRLAQDPDHAVYFALGGVPCGQRVLEMESENA